MLHATAENFIDGREFAGFKAHEVFAMIPPYGTPKELCGCFPRYVDKSLEVVQSSAIIVQVSFGGRGLCPFPLPPLKAGHPAPLPLIRWSLLFAPVTLDKISRWNPDQHKKSTSQSTTTTNSNSNTCSSVDGATSIGSSSSSTSNAIHLPDKWRNDTQKCIDCKMLNKESRCDICRTLVG